MARLMFLSKLLALRSTAAHRITPIASYSQAREKVGNRDIVGFGLNGEPSYIDRSDFPCPAVRFMENKPDVLALREKEKSDWKTLSLDEKKALYRASFCSTFAEMESLNKGEWKSVLAGVITAITISLWAIVGLKKFVYEDLPKTFTQEWQEGMLKRMIDQHQGPVEGVSSKWDYEKREWK